MKNLSKKILVSVVALALAALTALCIFVPKQNISESERRQLKQFPELSIQTITSGRFMSEFEEYAADQFPFREAWRALKANIVLGLFNQSDNNDLFIKNGSITKIEYPLNSASIKRAADIFNKVYNGQIKGTDCKVYYSLIPDKNFFYGDKHLKMDYAKLERIMADTLADMKYIDIFGTLTADSYYKTDTHWRQETLTETAIALGSAMGADVRAEYKEIRLPKPFYGVYYGQSALRLEPDSLIYLTNGMLDACTVYDYQNEREIPVYDLTKAEGQDPYEMYLGGPLSLVEIKNPNAKIDRELVIFRDSFTSAIAPMLVEGYSKITLVDIRYISRAVLPRFIAFEAQDVLFLYSTSVLNNSETIK